MAVIKPFHQQIYFGMALDPIHVGTGGYRLSRVDNAIVRDFDGIPKVPGTSLEGCARAYAALKISNDENKKLKTCAGKRTCGKNNCAICVTFGYTSEAGQSLSGMSQFIDARILFFPVATMVGPVWVTSPRLLKELHITNEEPETNGQCLVSQHLQDKVLEQDGTQKVINLGWLLLNISPKKHTIDENTEFSLNSEDKKVFKDSGLNLPEIFNRLVVVSDTVISQIINSNLEVRTSVAIDPETGAAESGALFSYEAIPRTTVLWFGVTYLNPGNFDVDLKGFMENVKKFDQEPKAEDWQYVETVVQAGLDYYEYLGVGGIGTRGFGRFKVLK